jgi:hypothetical protein
MSRKRIVRVSLRRLRAALALTCAVAAVSLSTHSVTTHPVTSLPPVRVVGSSKPPPGAFGAKSLRSFYGLTDADAVRGTRSRIYIIDYFNQYFVSDLNTYRTQYGLGACTVETGCLQTLDVNGMSSTFPANGGKFSDHSTGVAEVASAICPRCGITAIRVRYVSVLKTSETYPEVLAIITAHELHAKHVNDSLGGDSIDAGDAPRRDVFLWSASSSGKNGAGVVYGVGAGNDGYQGDTGNAGFVDWPRSSPMVVAVGGVDSLLADEVNKRFRTAYPATQSSCAGAWETPKFQDGVSSAVCAGRATADLAGAAAKIAVFGHVNGAPGTEGWTSPGGTSLAAPAITALSALVGDPPPGASVNGYVYRNAQTAPTTLYDVTKGNNWSESGSGSNCDTKLCNAGPGWDGPTGWGVPVGTDVLRPPNDGVGAAKADVIRVNSIGGCLGVASNAVFVPPWPKVRTVSCTDANYYVKWQAVPVMLKPGGPIGFQYVLENKYGGFNGCLSAQPLKPVEDGDDVVVGPCTAQYGLWYPRKSGQLQQWTSKKYLYAPSTTTGPGNAQLWTAASTRFVVPPTP